MSTLLGGSSGKRLRAEAVDSVDSVRPAQRARLAHSADAASHDMLGKRLRRDGDPTGGAGGAPKMRRVDAIDVDDSMDAHDDVGSEDEWEPVCEVTEDGTVVNHVPWEGQHAGS